MKIFYSIFFAKIAKFLVIPVSALLSANILFKIRPHVVPEEEAYNNTINNLSLFQ